MELSAQVLCGLEALGALQEETFQTILERSLQAAIQAEGKDLPGQGDGVCKETTFALSTLFLESARVDADSTTLCSVLEEGKVDSIRSKAITALFSENKTKLRAALDRLSSDSMPHLVDAQWRLDYYIKNNHTEKVNKAEYLIQLNTESSDNTKAVQFACTQEQLQDLVTSLKDATKSLGRIAQQN